MCLAALACEALEAGIESEQFARLAQQIMSLSYNNYKNDLREAIKFSLVQATPAWNWLIAYLGDHQLIDFKDNSDDLSIFRTSFAGVSILHLLVEYEAWELVGKFVRYDITADDFNKAAQCGRLKGRTVFWVLVHERKYDLINIVVKKCHGLRDAKDEAMLNGMTISTMLSMLTTAPKVMLVRDSIYEQASEDQRLLFAVYCENEDYLRKIFRVRTDMAVNALDHGSSILHYAVFHQRMKMIRVLGSVNSFEVNYKDGIGRPALIFAASFSEVEVVRCLVEELGADINLQADNNNDALDSSVQNRDVGVFKYLYELHLANPGSTRLADISLYKRVFAYGSVSLVKYFYQQQLRVSKVHADDLCRRGIFKAARHGNLAVVRYLIEEHNLDPAMKKRDKSLVESAVLYDQAPVLSYLLDNCQVDHEKLVPHKLSLLAWAVQSNSEIVVRYLVQQHPEMIASMGEDKIPSFLYAVQIGNMRMMQCFMRQDPEVIMQTAHGRLGVMHFSAINGSVDLLQYFMREHDVPFGDKTELGMIAAMHGHVELMRYLMQKDDCFIGDFDDAHMRCFLCAAENEQLEMMRYLVGFDRNVLLHKNRSGQDGLFFAAEIGSVACVQYIVEEMDASFPGTLLQRLYELLITQGEFDYHCEVEKILVAFFLFRRIKQYCWMNDKIPYVYYELEQKCEVYSKPYVNGDVPLVLAINCEYETAINSLLPHISSLSVMPLFVARLVFIAQTDADVPDRFYCAITASGVIMFAPFYVVHKENDVLVDGHVFEESAISIWRDRSNECPLTRKSIHTVRPYLFLDDEIDAFIRRYYPFIAADDIFVSVAHMVEFMRAVMTNDPAKLGVFKTESRYKFYFFMAISGKSPLHLMVENDLAEVFFEFIASLPDSEKAKEIMLFNDDGNMSLLDIAICHRSWRLLEKLYSFKELVAMSIVLEQLGDNVYSKRYVHDILSYALESEITTKYGELLEKYVRLVDVRVKEKKLSRQHSALFRLPAPSTKRQKMEFNSDDEIGSDSDDYNRGSLSFD